MDEYRKHGHRIVTLKRLRAYIKTFRNLFSPIIDSCRKTIRDAAKLIASLIQDSFGTCISSKIRICKKDLEQMPQSTLPSGFGYRFLQFNSVYKITVIFL